MIPIQHVHPMLVHFPIVFFLTLVVFDIVASFGGKAVTGRSAAGGISTSLAVLAGLFALVTFYFGGMALDVAEAQGFHSEVAEIHEGLGTTTAIAFAAWALIRLVLWWRDVKFKGAISAAIPLVEVAGAILVTATAYYGGQLVYGLGVNVMHGA